MDLLVFSIAYPYLTLDVPLIITENWDAVGPKTFFSIITELSLVPDVNYYVFDN